MSANKYIQLLTRVSVKRFFYFVEKKRKRNGRYTEQKFQSPPFGEKVLIETKERNEKENNNTAPLFRLNDPTFDC